MELGKEQIVSMVYKDKINSNNWRLPLSIWKKAFLKEIVQENLKNGTLYIIKDDKYDTWTDRTTLDDDMCSCKYSEVLGVITNIDLDKKEATVRLLKNNEIDLTEYGLFASMWAEFSDIVNVNNGFNHNQISSMSLLGFTLKPLNKSTYIEY